MMCDSVGVSSPAIGVGWVGKGLVSDSDVESSMSEGQTSMSYKACRSVEQQCSWLELTTPLKHLLICGLVRCEVRMVIMCPVFAMEFVMALRVSPVSHSREPKVVRGGCSAIKTVKTDVANGEGVFVKGGFIKVFVMSWW